jgi:hypothetical protein
MDSLPFASIVVRGAMSRTALSALPDAPVLIDRDRVERPVRLRGTRRAMAAGLRRTADRVAPPARCTTAPAR